MAGDRLIFNTLERALSSDVNDAQAIGSRSLADILRLLVSTRWLFDQSDDVQHRSASLGLAFAVGGDLQSLDVQPGVLLQQSTTWPAAPGALDSEMRVGIQRGVVNVPVPATPSRAMLLEARVLDVVTVSAVRDIFDVPTQTFIPGNVPKQSERRIEYQVVVSPGATFPAFSGNPWVPICGFFTDGGGQLIAGPPSSILLDCRQDVRDVLADVPRSDDAEREVSDAFVESAESWTLDGAGFFGQNVGGNFSARLQRDRVFLRSQTGMIPTADSAVTGTQNDREWIYLAPLRAGGLRIMPIVNGVLDEGFSKGVLVRSASPPSEEGPHNRVAFTFAAGTLYENFGSVPEKGAVLVNQCFVVPPSLAAGGYQPWTQSRGGVTIMRRKTTAPQSTDLFGVASFVGNLGAGPQIETLDLRSKVPRNARMARLEVVAAATVGLAGHSFYVELRRRAIADVVWRSSVIDGATAFIALSEYAEIPVKTSLVAGGTEGQRYEVYIVKASGANPLAIAVTLGLVGWAF